MKKILLISTILPCTNYSGGIYVEQVVNYLLEKKYEITFVCLRDKYIVEKTTPRIISKLKIHSFDIEEKAANLSDKILEILEEQKINKVFLMMVREKTLNILSKINKQKSVDYFILSDDPFEWTMKALKYNPIRKLHDLKLRHKVFSNAKGIFCASDYMTENYAKKFNVKTAQLYTSNREKNILKKAVKKSNKIYIGFSGQPYATDAIISFFKTLDAMNWKFKNKEIVFNYYGSSDMSFIENENNKKHIKIYSWLSQSDLIKELNKCDYVYCPYFFDKDSALMEVSKNSFPSKVVTYLLSGTNIIVHAPEYSSIYKFLKQDNIAHFITDCNKDLKEDLLAIFNEQNKEYDALNKCYRDNFLYHNVRDKFIEDFENM